MFNLSKTSILDVVDMVSHIDGSVLGKHEDSVVIFSFNRDSKYIYATDADAPESDVFSDCHIANEFSDVLCEYGLSFEAMSEYFKPLFDSEYEFSNLNETGSARLSEVFG